MHIGNIVFSRYHMEIRGGVSRNTLSDANKVREFATPYGAKNKTRTFKPLHDSRINATFPAMFGIVKAASGSERCCLREDS